MLNKCCSELIYSTTTYSIELVECSSVFILYSLVTHCWVKPVILLCHGELNVEHLILNLPTLNQNLCNLANVLSMLNQHTLCCQTGLTIHLPHHAAVPLWEWSFFLVCTWRGFHKQLYANMQNNFVFFSKI